MAKGRLPEGYRGVDKIIEEFRAKNPKGKIETAPVLVGDGFILITARITSDDGAVGSGMSEADVQEEKDVQKAESGAIRRALLTLGYKSLEEEDDEDKKQVEREVKKDPRSDSAKARDSEDKEEKKEERTKSRFGNKSSEKKETKRAADDDDEEDQEEDEKSEGESKFKRGSRFQRS